MAEGTARGFAPEADAPRKVIVVRSRGTFVGWLDNCPHYLGGTPMAWRKDAYLDGSGEYLSCHAHGALFEIDSGECVTGPCMGQALTAVPLAVDRSGMVRLAGDIDWTDITI